MSRIMRLVLVCAVCISSGYSQVRNRSRFGIYYSQTSSTVFSWGIVQEKEGNRIPLEYLLSLGYVYDNRTNKKYGHGVDIEWVLAPFFSRRDFKFGPFFGVGVLFEAIKLLDVDIMYRERDLGLSTGIFANGWDHVSVRVGAMKYFDMSKFFTQWIGYPPRFTFSVCLTL